MAPTEEYAPLYKEMEEKMHLSKTIIESKKLIDIMMQQHVNSDLQSSLVLQHIVSVTHLVLIPRFLFLRQ